MGVLIPLLLISICCYIIWRAGDGFETASLYLGRNLSEGVRGATINAIGSSTPELLTTFIFLFYLEDIDGFSGGIGTTAGSSVFNGMIIPALVIMVVIFAGVVKNITVSKRVLIRDGLSLLTAEIIFIMFIGGSSLTWVHGLILMFLYFLYFFYMFYSIRNNPRVEGADEGYEEEPQKIVNQGFFTSLAKIDLERLVIGGKKLKTGNSWVLLIVTMFVMMLACLVLVQACEWIGSATYNFPLLGQLEGLNVPVLFVAVILASAATSIPDTILSIKDAKKGNYDDAVSNALGSNIFDICFALGFPLFLYTLINGPIEMSEQIILLSAELRMLLFIVTLVAFAIYVSGSKLGMGKAIGLLSLYMVFTAYTVARSKEIAWVEDIATFLQQMALSISVF